MTQTQNEAEFEFEWLLRQKYEFKILTLIAVLADNNLAYRGTLNDMCDFFGVRSNDSRNRRSIKAAIDQLETDGLLKHIEDGKTLTLTLSKKGEQRKRVIRIQKEWVEIAKNYKSDDNSISWMNLLKVWLFLLDNKKEIIKISDITKAKKIICIREHICISAIWEEISHMMHVKINAITVVFTVSTSVNK